MWVDAGSLPVFAGVQYAVAIVADGNTHPAIADGQFVYVRNHSTLAEGLYKASEAISENGALSTSNLTADSAGGLNDLQAQVTTLNDKIAVTEATIADSIAIVANGDTHAAITSGQYVYVKNHGILTDGLYKATAAIGTNATLSTSNLTADGNGGLNDLKGQVDSLNSNMTQILCKKSKAPGASQIAIGEKKSYNVDDLIPTGYVPISVCYEQYAGTSNAHLECSLFKTSTGEWRVGLYNYYNGTLNINPLITVWSVKAGYYS
jgi:hypothetical protein